MEGVNSSRSRPDLPAVPTGLRQAGLAIQVKGLTKAYGHFLALKSLDLAVAHGESVAIFGPNGAGKTTLIKVLATITNATGGQVLIDGLNLKDQAEDVRRRIGVVTHQTFLYGNLTAYENLDFYGRMYDVPDRKTRIAEVTELVSMTPRLHDRVGSFSRGMQQRLSIARALLHRPCIILLDEPETGLDQQAIFMLWTILQKDEQKRTVLLTTHNLERGLQLSDRVLILDKGKITYQASSQSLDLASLKDVYQTSTGVAA